MKAQGREVRRVVKGSLNIREGREFTQISNDVLYNHLGSLEDGCDTSKKWCEQFGLGGESASVDFLVPGR